MKTLLIIGASGFFGQSILNYLLDFKDSKKKINKIILFSRNKFQNRELLKKLSKKFKVIEINSNILYANKLPLASYVIYTAIASNYDQDYLSVKNYCSLAKKYHKKSLILYVSSGAVYGKQTKNRDFNENYLNRYKKVNYRDSYKEKYSNVKLKNEQLFQKLGFSGLNVSIARCFSVVGEFIPRNSIYVIGNIIQNLLDKKDILISANYKIFRSYMFSHDLANWLLKILYYSNTKCPIFNVGSDDMISIHKIANLLSKKYKLNLRLPKKISKNKFDKYIPNILNIN